jgi:hypothetical protein
MDAISRRVRSLFIPPSVFTLDHPSADDESRLCVCETGDAHTEGSWRFKRSTPSVSSIASQKTW